MHQGEVDRTRDLVLVGNQPAGSKARAGIPFFQAFDKLVLFETVADQVRDAADLQSPFGGEFLQLGAPRHAAVSIEDLHNCRGGRHSGEARQVAARLGVAGAAEHAAGLRHDREDVSGLAKVLRTRARCGSHPDGMRPIMRGNSRCNTLRRLD